MEKEKIKIINESRQKGEKKNGVSDGTNEEIALIAA